MRPWDVQTLTSSNSDVICKTKQKNWFFKTFLVLQKLETPRQLYGKSRMRDAHTHQKTSLREPWNSTKILRDPRFLKDHSFPPGWDTSQSQVTLQLSVRLTHYSSIPQESCPKAGGNNPGQVSSPGRSIRTESDAQNIREPQLGGRGRK